MPCSCLGAAAHTDAPQFPKDRRVVDESATGAAEQSTILKEKAGSRKVWCACVCSCCGRSGQDAARPKKLVVLEVVLVRRGQRKWRQEVYLSIRPHELLWSGWAGKHSPKDQSARIRDAARCACPPHLAPQLSTLLFLATMV
eukprot:1124627-Pelagomonas_calceolata.AAC.4